MSAKFLLILVSSLTLTACASMGLPGGVSVRQSDYDNTKLIYMNPGWANNDMGGTLKIGARKNSKMLPNEAILIVRNDVIGNFSFSQPNLFIKIDGEETKLSPIERTTEITLASQTDPAHSSQEYSVDMAFIKKMLSAKDVKFKLNLEGNYFVEGSLWRDGWSTAKSGLIDFVANVERELGQHADVRTPAGGN